LRGIRERGIARRRLAIGYVRDIGRADDRIGLRGRQAGGLLWRGLGRDRLRHRRGSGHRRRHLRGVGRRFEPRLGRRGLAGQILEAARAVGIVKLIPLRVSRKGQAARVLDRVDVRFLHQSNGGHQTQARHREQGDRQDCAEDKSEIRDHPVHRSALSSRPRSAHASDRGLANSARGIGLIRFRHA
jgi:hypothetical protein